MQLSKSARPNSKWVGMVQLSPFLCSKNKIENETTSVRNKNQTASHAPATEWVWCCRQPLFPSAVWPQALQLVSWILNSWARQQLLFFHLEHFFPMIALEGLKEFRLLVCMVFAVSGSCCNIFSVLSLLLLLLPVMPDFNDCYLTNCLMIRLFIRVLSWVMVLDERPGRGKWEEGVVLGKVVVFFVRRMENYRFDDNCKLCYKRTNY